MRVVLLIVCGFVLSGCASSPPKAASNSAAPIYDQAISAALVYAPPVTLDIPPLDLARDGRDQAAFAGFEDVTTTFYHLREDDYQASYGRRHHNDRFEREATTERFGVSYR